MRHRLYQVDTRTPEGWRLGMKVWMLPAHFSAFLTTVRRNQRVRRVVPLATTIDNYSYWTGKTLRVGAEPK